MKLSFFRSAIVIAAFTVQCLPAMSDTSSASVTYDNDRYGFSIAYSGDIFTSATIADNGDGISLKSADGAAEAKVYGSEMPGVLMESLADCYREALSQPERAVIYKTLNVTQRFFVISGIEDGQVFYLKSFIEDGIEKTFVIHSPFNAKRLYNTVTKEMVASFNPDSKKESQKDQINLARHSKVLQQATSQSPAFDVRNFRSSCYGGPYTPGSFYQCEPQQPGNVMNAYSKAEACAVQSATVACRAAGRSSCQYIGVESFREAGAPNQSAPGGPPSNSSVCYVNVIVQGH